MIPRYKMLSSKVKCPSSKQENSPVYQTSPPYRIAPSEKEIMKEIMENGPVQGANVLFLLCENFRSVGNMSHKKVQTYLSTQFHV